MAISQFVPYFEALFRNFLGKFSGTTYTKTPINAAGDMRFTLSYAPAPLNITIFENSAHIGVFRQNVNSVSFDVPSSASASGQFVFGISDGTRNEQFKIYGTNAEHIPVGTPDYRTSGGWGISNTIPGAGQTAGPTLNTPPTPPDPYPVNVTTAVADNFRAQLDPAIYTVSVVDDTGSGAARQVSFTIRNTQGGTVPVGTGNIRFTPTQVSSSEVKFTIDNNVSDGNNIIINWGTESFVATTLANAPWIIIATNISPPVVIPPTPDPYPVEVATAVADYLRQNLDATIYNVDAVTDTGTGASRVVEFTINNSQGSVTIGDTQLVGFTKTNLSGNRSSFVIDNAIAVGTTITIDVDGTFFEAITLASAPWIQVLPTSTLIPQVNSPAYVPVFTEIHEALAAAINSGPDAAFVNAVVAFDGQRKPYVDITKRALPILEVYEDPSGSSLTPPAQIWIDDQASNLPQSIVRVQIVNSTPGDVASVIIDGKIYTVNQTSIIASGTPATAIQIQNGQAATAATNAARAAAGAQGTTTSGNAQLDLIPTSKTGPFHRQLLTVEANPLHPDYSRYLGLDPQDATKITMPVFDVGTTPPPAGKEAGHAFFSTNRGQAYVWDGSKWANITASTIISFADKASMNAVTGTPIGTFACTIDTGNLFLRTNLGWKSILLTRYPNYAAMKADTGISDGATAVLLDENSFWEWDDTRKEWFCLGTRLFNTYAEMNLWTTAKESSLAFVTRTNILYIRGTTNWKPLSVFYETFMRLASSTDHSPGQIAITSDTKERFVFNGTRWIASQIKEFPTEADLLAIGADDDTLAWGADSHKLHVYGNNVWNRREPGKFDPPAGSKVAGDFFINTARRSFKIDTGAGQSIIVPPLEKSPIANRSTWSNAEYGSMHMDPATESFSIAGKDNWRTFSNSAIRCVNKEVLSANEIIIDTILDAESGEEGVANDWMELELAVNIGGSAGFTMEVATVAGNNVIPKTRTGVNWANARLLALQTAHPNSHVLIQRGSGASSKPGYALRKNGFQRNNTKWISPTTGFITDTALFWGVMQVKLRYCYVSSNCCLYHIEVIGTHQNGAEISTADWDLFFSGNAADRGIAAIKFKSDRGTHDFHASLRYR